jgi:hypothetical protein
MGGRTGRAGTSSRRTRSDDELLGLDDHGDRANSSVRQVARGTRGRDSTGGKKDGEGRAGDHQVLVEKRGGQRIVDKEVDERSEDEDEDKCDESSVDSLVEGSHRGGGGTSQSVRFTESRLVQHQGKNDAGQMRLKGTVSVAPDASLHNVSSLSGGTSDSARERHESMLIANLIPTVFKATKFFGSAEDIGHESKIAEFFYDKLCIKDPVAKRMWWERRHNDVRKKLDAKRSSVTNAIKHEYMSKYRLGRGFLF